MRKPITAESLAKSRPRVHKALDRALTTRDGRIVADERCECGCARVVLMNSDGKRTHAGSWT